eukprot:scaffold6949_cov107-Cylindrotheca_fusiformis.AAC.1
MGHTVDGVSPHQPFSFTCTNLGNGKKYNNPQNAKRGRIAQIRFLRLKRLCTLLALLFVEAVFSAERFGSSQGAGLSGGFPDSGRSDGSDSTFSVWEEERIISAIAQTEEILDSSLRCSRSRSKIVVQNPVNLHGRPTSSSKRRVDVEAIHSQINYKAQNGASRQDAGPLDTQRDTSPSPSTQTAQMTTASADRIQRKLESRSDVYSKLSAHAMPSQLEASPLLNGRSSGTTRRPFLASSGQSKTRVQRQIPSSETKIKSQKNCSTITPWVRKFLSDRPKDVLLPVPNEFIEDGFNLAQLAPIIERIGFQILGENAVSIAKELMQTSEITFPIYRLALQLILNENENENLFLQHPLIPPNVIQEAAEALYLMVHARFCQSPRGLDALRGIVRTEMYGKCPRVSCRGSPLLPYGSSSNYSRIQQKSSCSRYCPTCGEVWSCWESKTDGCAFGPDLCHLFLLMHGAEIYSTTKSSGKAESVSLPKHAVMGFLIHPSTIWGRPLKEM